MVVLGAGIAAEISGVSQQLGSQVAWAYRKERPLRTFDKMLADNLVEMYQESGIGLCRLRGSRIIKEFDEYLVHFENGETLTGDASLCWWSCAGHG